MRACVCITRCHQGQWAIQSDRKLHGLVSEAQMKLFFYFFWVPECRLTFSFVFLIITFNQRMRKGLFPPSGPPEDNSSLRLLAGFASLFLFSGPYPGLPLALLYKRTDNLFKEMQSKGIKETMHAHSGLGRVPNGTDLFSIHHYITPLAPFAMQKRFHP